MLCGRLEMSNCKILASVLTLVAPSIDNNKALLATPLLNTRCGPCKLISRITKSGERIKEIKMIIKQMVTAILILQETNVLLCAF